MLFFLWMCFSLVLASPIETTLDNGMNIIIDQTNHIPQVSMQLHFSFSPQDYPEGLPHLVEHLLFEMEKDGVLYDHWVEKQNGFSNARTRWSEIIVETTVSSEAMEALLAWEAWRMQNFCSSLKDENIENQKMIIVQEMLNQEFRQLGSVPDRLRKAVFSDHDILGAEVMGSVADLEQIGQDELCRFARDIFHPSQARLILAGDVSISQVQAVGKRLFSAEKKDAIVKNHAQKKPVQTRWFLPSSKESRLYIVWIAPAYATREEIASDFLLEQLISDQFGILSDYFSLVSGWSEASAQAGWRVIELETEDPNAALKTLQQILRSPELWLEEKDLQLFQVTTKSLIAKLQLKNTERARLLGECSLAEKGGSCFAWEEERREKLALEEAIQYLERGFSLESASLLWVGSENQIEGKRLP